MDPIAIITLIEQLVAAIGVGTTDAITAWNTVSKIVQEHRNPTSEEWASANSAADTAHVDVQAVVGSDR